MYERIKATQQHLPKDIEHITRPQLLQFTRDTLSLLGIRLRRGMGQHFLVSPEVLRFILRKANLKSNDTILEIGGGIGTLSLFIAPQVKKLIIIEQDHRLIDVLYARLREFNNVKIIPGGLSAIPTIFAAIIKRIPAAIKIKLIFLLLAVPNNFSRVFMVLLFLCFPLRWSLKIQRLSLAFLSAKYGGQRLSNFLHRYFTHVNESL